MKNPRDIIFSPVVSEKSYDLIEDPNPYAFELDPRVNQTGVKQAIETIFSVKVVRVNTQNRKGKLKRTGYVMGKRSDVKRALVTLADGDEIDIFGV